MNVFDLQRAFLFTLANNCKQPSSVSRSEYRCQIQQQFSGHLSSVCHEGIIDLCLAKPQPTQKCHSLK